MSNPDDGERVDDQGGYAPGDAPHSAATVGGLLILSGCVGAALSLLGPLTARIGGGETAADAALALSTVVAMGALLVGFVLIIAKLSRAKTGIVLVSAVALFVVFAMSWWALSLVPLEKLPQMREKHSEYKVWVEAFLLPLFRLWLGTLVVALVAAQIGRGGAAVGILAGAFFVGFVQAIVNYTGVGLRAKSAWLSLSAVNAISMGLWAVIAALLTWVAARAISSRWGREKDTGGPQAGDSA